MPAYSFLCESCNHADLEVMSMAHAVPFGERTICPKCRAEDYVRQVDYVHTDLKEFQTPIQMMSIACNSMEEIREIQTKCPDVQISDDPEDELFGIPVVKNRHEKLSVLKATGYVERK